MIQPRVGPLVRAVSPHSAIIWTEWTYPCDVTLKATKACEHGNEQDASVLTACMHTVAIGTRHYALLRLDGLYASTWYDYHVTCEPDAGEQAEDSAASTLKQCFRTLDLPEMGNSLRLAYGSCRKPSAVEPDALNAFGPWLMQRFDERETAWPRLLLLIGDQIYADDRIGRHKGRASLTQNASPATPQRAGARTFAEFAALYEQAWAGDSGIRQVLATIPTFMIFDDHEITNSWNTSPDWRARALKHGLEQMLVDGLVAYWVYQGWGNPGAQSEGNIDLAAIMQEAAQSGENALEHLRACMRQAVYEEIAPHWHYEILTMPPIFVMDVRADRPAILRTTDDTCAPARIMSRAQMSELHAWVKSHDTSTVLLVSSVPVLLPPLIGLAEYIMGIRPLHNTPLRHLGQLLARVQRRVTRRMSFDHWPVFAATWRELVRFLAGRKHDVVVLSGDVHFSYATEAQRGIVRSQQKPTLYQLVASPFANALHKRDQRLVRAQARIKRAIYGGLHIRMRRLAPTNAKANVAHDLLIQNTVALVTLEPQSTGNNTGKYGIRQVYLGIVDGKLEEIACLYIDRNSPRVHS
ncbi:MAG TPA: alkaline phosphatase D family protein [Ktedonobacteraceae bacterium]|nr:alkaline phosphatase D family protein [Ktedonobacteraceae bacterium]